MARFNRINLDGKSRTESRVSAVELLPGTALLIADDLFVKADATSLASDRRQLYVATAAYYQGMGTPNAIPAGDTVEGEYFTEGRQVAVLAAKGAVLTMDTPLTLDAATGTFKAADLAVAEGANEPVLAYSKETVTVSSSEAELVLVQVA